MAIQAHNEKAAASWGSGGTLYDRVSETIADSIEHLLNRLQIQPGEKVLDLATGTGWTARRMAQKGAHVTGLDIGAGVIEAAKDFAKQANLQINFAVGDAEQVDLPSGSFDVITSTCGVMFASQPEKVAAELSRLVRPGGRLGLTTWPPTGLIAQLFAIMRPYMPPPSTPSPFEWGREERVSELLGDAFALKFETGITNLRLPSTEAFWSLMVEGYGPMKTLYASTERKEDLKRDFLDFHEPFMTDIGLTIGRDYLVTIGTRR